MKPPTLAIWQDAFTAYLQNGIGETWLCAQITKQSIAPELRLDVYRNAYYIRLEEALARDFPALRAAIGDHDFGRLMAEYLHSHPSISPTVRDLGHALPRWLRARGKMECADLATIEWAVLNACDAADTRLIDSTALVQLAPEHWATLRVRLHPSLTLLALDSNAAVFWQAQHAATARPLLAPSPTNWLVVVRNSQGAALIKITPAQHAVLMHLSREETLATVCAAMIHHTMPQEISYFVAETLARAAASGWVCEIDGT